MIKKFLCFLCMHISLQTVNESFPEFSKIQTSSKKKKKQQLKHKESNFIASPESLFTNSPDSALDHPIVVKSFLTTCLSFSSSFINFISEHMLILGCFLLAIIVIIVFKKTKLHPPIINNDTLKSNETNDSILNTLREQVYATQENLQKKFDLIQKELEQRFQITQEQINSKYELDKQKNNLKLEQLQEQVKKNILSKLEDAENFQHKEQEKQISILKDNLLEIIQKKINENQQTIQNFINDQITTQNKINQTILQVQNNTEFLEQQLLKIPNELKILEKKLLKIHDELHCLDIIASDNSFNENFQPITRPKIVEPSTDKNDQFHKISAADLNKTDPNTLSNESTEHFDMIDPENSSPKLNKI